MNALIMRLRLREPVLATRPQSGEPNSSVTLGYIPGSMLRGAAVAAFLAQSGSRAADEPDLRRLFLSGALHFLHAYPEGPRPGDRMLPTPRSWLIEKDDVDAKGAAAEDAACGPLSLRNPKRPSGDYTWRSAESNALTKLLRQAAVHTASEDRNRKEEGASQVYRYEALAAGQTLVAAVLAANPADLDCALPALAGITRLGGARSGGYGSVEILDLRHDQRWREYEPADVAGATGDEDEDRPAVITLLSDAILRTAAGQGGAGLDDFLHAQYGLPQPLAAYQQRLLVGGFNRTTGLPLPQAWAIAAGSVYVYVRTPALLAALEPLLEGGVGERTDEGFGRLALDWQAAGRFTVHRLPVAEEAAALPPGALAGTTLAGKSEQLAALMARRRLAAKLQQALASQISRFMAGLDHLPSATQLARAQLAARRAYTESNLAIIDQHFANLKSARQHWLAATVAGENLLDWIQKQTHLGHDAFVQQFGLAEEGVPAVAGTVADLSDKVRAQAIAQLIEGLLRQAVKQQKRRAESPLQAEGRDTA